MTIQQVEATYISRGTCRHCGGRIPCWSMVGDKVPHSEAAVQRAMKFLQHMRFLQQRAATKARDAKRAVSTVGAKR